MMLLFVSFVVFLWPATPGWSQKTAAPARTRIPAKNAATENKGPTLGKPKLLLDANGTPLRWTVQPRALVRAAGESGDGAAMDHLGDLGNKDFSWYLRSANTGYLPGIMDVAAAYEAGPKADPVQAKLWEDKVKAALPQAWQQHDGHVDNQIALHYMQGTAGLPKDNTEAFKWVRHAAGYNDPEALLQLAGWTSRGLKASPNEADKAGAVLIPKATDYHQWSAYLEQAADSGDPEAEVSLGAQLAFGGLYQPAMPASRDLGFAWLTKAAQQGYFPAIWRLAGALLPDSDAERKKEGEQWLTKGIKAGDEESLTLLGEFYLEADATFQNRKLGLKLLEDAAASLDGIGAERVLALVYGNGIGVTQSNEIAERWLRKSLANSSEEEVSNEIGTFYSGNDFELFNGKIRPMTAKADMGRAIEIYRKAGNYTQLIDIFYNGSGKTPPDYVQAMSWCKRAFGENHPKYALLIAAMYEKGQGTSRDYAAAMTWYQKAYQTQQSSDDDVKYVQAAGAIGIGSMYAFGEGVPADSQKALELYRAALVLDVDSPEAISSEAAYLIGNLYRNGYGVPKDPGIALEWYKEALTRRGLWVESAVAVGDMLGSGEVKDPKSLDWQVRLYSKAGKENNLGGLEKLAHLYMSRSDWKHAAQENDYDDRVQTGTEYMQDTRRDWAISVATGLLVDFPMRWQGYALWGAIERRKNNLFEAAAAYQHALTLAPDEAKPTLALALEQINDLDRYDRLLASALTSWKNKQAPQALTATAGLISLDSQRWEGYYLSATIEQALGRKEVAQLAYKQALSLAPFDRKFEIASELQKLQ